VPRFLCPLFLLFLFFFAPQGTRQCLAHGCHLTLRGAADVGVSLLGGGEDVDGDGIADGASSTGGGVSGAERAALCGMAEAVYREYQRQLWDPSLGRDGGGAPGCSDAAADASASHGEWHFHKLGPRLGVFLLDVRERRLWGPTDAPPTEVPLVSPAQWRAIDQVLGLAGAMHLVMCSELPLVEDGPDDALTKSRAPGHGHLADGWPAHGPELRRLVSALATWQRHEAGRRVTLLCGGAGYHLVSQVEHRNGTVMTQVVAAPVTGSRARFWAEPAGVLDDDLSYSHGVPETGAEASAGSVVLLRFERDEADPKALNCAETQVTSAECRGGGLGGALAAKGGDSDDSDDDNDNAANNRGAGGAGFRAAAFEAAFERPEWLEVACARAVAAPPPASQRPKLKSLYAGLAAPDCVAALAKAFKGGLAGGAHPSTSDPLAFASAVTPLLTVWFYRDAGDGLRDAALPPSPFLVEATARWNASGTGSQPGGGGGRWTGDPGRALASGPAARLALLTEESFCGLVGEALALGLLIQDHLKTS